MGKGPRIDCSKDEVLTQQSGKDDADINVIIERAKRGAIIEPRPQAPVYGDFTQVPTDLRDALNAIRRADELFMSLDAAVRFRFHNDSQEMLEFLNDPYNRDEAIKLGLVKAPVVPVVDPVVETLKSIDSSLKASSGAKKSKPPAFDE